jgi:hypothetical protein
MDIASNVTIQLTQALGLAGANLILGLAQLVVVSLFVILGFLVAGFIIKLVNRGIDEAKAEKWLEQRGMHDALLGFAPKALVGTIVKLLTLSVFLGIAANVTNLGFVEGLVLWFISYVPRLIEGIVIISLALFGAEYVTEKISRDKEIPFGRAVGTAIKLFVGYTAVVIALPLVLPGADVEILKLSFLLLLGALALAIGLGMAIAIGLGAKDAVAAVAKRKEKELEKLI